MLLYVNKKQLKQQKLKRLTKILLCSLILILNITHFLPSLYKSQTSLTQYIRRPTPSHHWYHQAGTVTMFTAANSKSPKIFIIPTDKNKQNDMTIALALSKIPASATSISITPEIKNADYLLKLAQIFNPQLQIKDSPQSIIITTDLTRISALIHRQHLYPFVSNYKHAEKLSNNQQLMELLEQQYPTLPQPQNKIEQEQIALQHFVTDYREDIRQLLSYYTQSSAKLPPYKTHNALFQNISLCLQGAVEKICAIDENTSLPQTLKALSFKLSEPPQKIILLTSFAPLESPADLQQGDGALFKFQNRQYILLPTEIPASTTATLFKKIKLKAGINPDYHNNKMTFYKFKTVEIDINDNI